MCLSKSLQLANVWLPWCPWFTSPVIRIPFCGLIVIPSSRHIHWHYCASTRITVHTSEQIVQLYWNSWGLRPRSQHVTPRTKFLRGFHWSKINSSGSVVNMEIIEKLHSERKNHVQLTNPHEQQDTFLGQRKKCDMHNGPRSGTENVQKTYGKCILPSVLETGLKQTTWNDSDQVSNNIKSYRREHWWANPNGMYVCMYVGR